MMFTRSIWNKVYRGYLITFMMILFTVVFGCKGTKDVYSPKEWRDLLKAAGGWVPLPFPDSKYQPGAIIKVSDEGIRWIDHLKSCRFPSDVLEPEKSYIPSIQFTKARELGAGAMINFKGISAGPEFDRVSKVRMQIDEHGADAFRLINLKVWMEVPANREMVSGMCMEELLKPGRYLITEAFRVSKGKYTLFDKTGAAIKLRAPALGNLLQFEPDVKYEVTADGSLLIEQTAYFAVRMAVRVGNDWDILKETAGGTETADAAIESQFLQHERED